VASKVKAPMDEAWEAAMMLLSDGGQKE